jgi:hypothetical protein
MTNAAMTKSASPVLAAAAQVQEEAGALASVKLDVRNEPDEAAAAGPSAGRGAQPASEEGGKLGALGGPVVAARGGSGDGAGEVCGSVEGKEGCALGVS